MKNFFRDYGWAVLILAAIVAAVLALLYLPPKNSAPPTFSSTSTPAQSGPDLASQHITEPYAAENALITATYPHVIPNSVSSAGTSSAGSIIATGTADIINSAIDAKIKSAIADFEGNLVDWHKSSSPGLGAGGQGGYGTSTLDISYTEESHSLLKNTISFSLYESSYDAGAANPDSVVETFNFDTRTGELISLGNLLGPISVAVKAISDYSIADLHKQLGPGDQGNAGDQATSSDQVVLGAGPDVDNFGAFILTDDSLLAIFDQCQVTDCAAGAQEVSVPYSVILPFALPGTVLDSVRGEPAAGTVSSGASR